MTLREEVTRLAGIIAEEDSDEYIDDYEELPMPKGMKLTPDGKAYWNKKLVGVTPMSGDATFVYKKDCPKEVIDWFKESRYLVKQEA